MLPNPWSVHMKNDANAIFFFFYPNQTVGKFCIVGDLWANLLPL